MTSTNLVSATSLPWSKASGTSWSITLKDASGVTKPATAGNTLVVGAIGGAIATPSSPTGWTRGPAYGGGTLDLSLWFKTAAGGETTISGTLNGTGDHVVLYALELPGAFTFAAGTNTGTGITLDSTTDFTVAPAASTVSADSIVIGLFGVLQATAFSQANKFIQAGPAGVHAVDNAEQAVVSGAHAIIAAVTVADVDTTHRFPVTAAAGSYAATSQYIGSGPGKAFAAQAVFTRPAGVHVVNWANDVDRANHLIGRRRQNFYNVLPSGVIAGYPTTPSVQPGGTLSLKVDSGNAAFTTEIVRCGWNGHDTTYGGSTAAQLTGTAVVQASPTVDSTLGYTAMSGWTTNCTWSVPSDAPSGLYTAVFKLTSTGQTAATHFVVRPAAVTGKIAVVIPDHTHQAYNPIGATSDTAASVTGRSVYGAAGSPTNFALRGYGWHFDRPYLTGAAFGQTYIWDSEYPLIQFLEAQGYNLAYVSDTDLEGNTHLLDDAAMVILLGHHEYWTKDVFDAYENAKSAGVNVFAYGANMAGWRARVDGTDPRKVICYKDNGTRDVSAGFTGTGFNPAAVWTGTWRDSASAGGITNDSVRADIAAFGCRFVASGPITSAQMVYGASSKPHVRNAPTLAAGKTDTTANLGYELDSADGSTGQPTNLVILNTTSVAITTGANAAGTVYSTSTTVNATQVLWRHTSGALIWKSAGWRDWWSATRYRGGTPVATVDSDIQQYLLNMLYDLGAVPTAVTTLQPGTDAALVDPATGAPTGGRNAVAVAYGLTVPAASSTGGFFALMSP